ncbi:MAG: hypothetical protein NC293_02515 [Roseburia sp.]|nr:hypothetical protein [Roseburia sp.]
MSQEAIYTIVGLGIIGILLAVVAGIISLVLYILNSYALYMILKAVGYELAWLAWIPFCQYFAITMAFNYKNEPNISVFGIPVPRPAAGFAALIGTIASGIIPFIGALFPILAVLINGNILAEMFDVCEESETGKNLGMGIISSLIIFVQIAMFFKYMKKAKNGEIDIQRYAANH